MISQNETMDEGLFVASIKEILSVVAFVEIIINFYIDGIDGYDEMVNELTGRGSYSSAPKKLDLELETRATCSTRPSIEKPPILELKSLSSHLCYVFLRANNTFPIDIEIDLL